MLLRKYWRTGLQLRSCSRLMLLPPPPASPCSRVVPNGPPVAWLCWQDATCRSGTHPDRDTALCEPAGSRYFGGSSALPRPGRDWHHNAASIDNIGPASNCPWLSPRRGRLPPEPDAEPDCLCESCPSVACTHSRY